MSVGVSSASLACRCAGQIVLVLLNLNMFTSQDE